MVKMASSDRPCTSTVSKTAFLIFAGSEMCLHELHKASTVVEMALSDHPGT